MAQKMTVEWKWQQFSHLSGHELYQILRSRQQVFIVEQRCIYLDADQLDMSAWHLSGIDSAGNLVAYLRVVKPGKKYAEPAIGRVLTCSNSRGEGIGYQLMEIGIEQTTRQFPKQGIRISAQAHLQQFYTNLGFSKVSEVYLEDNIPHVEMYRPTD